MNYELKSENSSKIILIYLENRDWHLKIKSWNLTKVNQGSEKSHST